MLPLLLQLPQRTLHPTRGHQQHQRHLLLVLATGTTSTGQKYNFPCQLGCKHMQQLVHGTNM